MRPIVFGLWCAFLWARPFVSGELNPRFSEFIQWALLGTGLLLCWRRLPRSTPHSSALPWALAAWLGAGLLAIFITPQLAGARATWLALMAGAIVIPVVWCADAAERRGLLVGLACGGLLISTFAFLQFFAIFPSLAGMPRDTLIDRAIQDVATRRRVLGAFALPNFLAGYSIMLAPLTASALTEASGTRWRQTFLAVSLLAIGLATVLTQSLGALLAFFVACGVVMAQWRAQRRSLWVTWLFVGLALMVGLLITRPMLRQFGHLDNPMRNRLTYWQVTATIIREHPIRGVGLGQFRDWYDARHPPGSPRVVHAHNSYLEVWAEMGLFGLLAWLWVVWEVLRMAARGAPWLAVAAWAFVLHNLVDAPLYIAQVNVLWWVLVGLIAANAPETAERGESRGSRRC